MNCSRCETEFEASDSIGSAFSLCQDCWEQECSWQWWALVALLGNVEEPNVMTEHDLPRIYSPDVEGENPKDRIGQTKPPLHLIPPAAEVLEAIVMGLGARKYGAFNWRSAKVRATVYIAAAKRHLAQWLDGESNDVESGVSHLAHARACLGILLDAQATGNMVDDRPPNGAAATLIRLHGLRQDGCATPASVQSQLAITVAPRFAQDPREERPELESASGCQRLLRAGLSHIPKECE